MARRLLIVDDDDDLRLALSDYFSHCGYTVFEAKSCDAATYAAKHKHPDVAIVDYRLPDGTALDTLSRWQASHLAVPLIVLTGHSTLDLAVRAIKEGAENFLAKPVDLSVLRAMVESVSKQKRPPRNRATMNDIEAVDPFACKSKAIQELATAAKKVAGAGRPILIDGETGTGKGVLARWLHSNGPRPHGPFVAVNCASLSPELLESELFGHAQGAFTGAVVAKSGLFEVASGGTLFLDEIGDLGLAVQPKLLKALEENLLRRLGETRERRIDVQLIAASHQDLRLQVREGAFRSDLFYRISMLPLTMPALRSRGDDDESLATEFAQRYGASIDKPTISLSEDAYRAISQHGWPGNVRELRNVIERSVLLSDQDVITAADLQFESTGSTVAPPRNLTLKDFEKSQIEHALREESGNVVRAARRLGMPRSTLYYKLRKARQIEVA